MAAYGSIKDLTKALHNFFATPPSPKQVQGTYVCQPLTADLQQSVQAFVDKHRVLDETDCERLQEDLIHIHQAHVLHDRAKLAPFLFCLCLFRPLIVDLSRLTKLWNIAIAPVIDGTGYKIVEVERATDFVLSLLDFNPEQEDSDNNLSNVSHHFSRILFDTYLRRTKGFKSHTEQLTLDDTLISRQLEDVLISYGRRKPKEFLIDLDRLLVERQNRMQALGLLSAFARHQPPHLHLVIQTPLIEHLLKCLLIDTSTTVISLALSCLIMFLPHIPSSVKAHLPRLFLIYSRILCWERFAPSSADNEDSEGSKEQSESPEANQPSTIEDEDWAKLPSSFDAAESTAPELLHYFTFLYGLYPLNFTSYIRKPRRYLKDIHFPRAEEFDLDQTVIRARSEQFRRVHLMHPNFYNTTAEDELTDTRWLKSDPTDVVSDCMSLCVATAPEHKRHDSGPTTTASLPDIPSHFVPTDEIPSQSLLDKEEDISLLGTLVEDKKADDPSPLPADPVLAKPKSLSAVFATPSTQSPATTSPSTHPLDEVPDSPILPTPKFVVTESRDNLPQRKDSGSSFPSTLNQSPHMNALKSRSQLPRSPAVRPTSQVESNMAFLQREIMLLRSDLNFERFLKQQHLVHIGQLQRRHIKEATIEAETQNLINTNRSLKAQLAKADDAYGSLKKEAATGRSQAKKLEAELSARVRTLREDEKKWRAEEEAMRAELDKHKTDCDHLRQLVVSSEARELLAKQELSFAEIKLEQVKNLQNRITELESTLRRYEAEEISYAAAKEEKASLQQQLDEAQFVAENRDAHLEMVTKEFQDKMTEMDAKFRAMQQVAGPQMQTMLDNVVGAVESKYSRLKEEHAALQQRYMDLEQRLNATHLSTTSNGLDQSNDTSSLPPQTASSSFLATDD